MKTIKRVIALITVFLLIIPTLSFFAFAEKDTYNVRYSEAKALPIKETVTFDHTNDNISSEVNIYFEASKGSLVSITFPLYLENRKEQTVAKLSAAIYDDSGRCISRSGLSDTIGALTFLCGYGGKYCLTVTSRSAQPVTFEATVNVDQATISSFFEVSSLPYKKTVLTGNKSCVPCTTLHSEHIFECEGECTAAIFKIPQTAAGAISYKINQRSSSGHLESILYTFEGENYKTRIGKQGDGYVRGDATEISYNGEAYLFVYTTGDFDISIDFTKHTDYLIDKITLPYSSKIYLSDSRQLYESEDYESLISDFPFTDIKNRSVKLFSMDVPKSSVVTVICDRTDYKYISLLSDESGLSYNSVYPLREHGSYYSESSPSPLCYKSFISDGEKVYLSYTGSDTSAYVYIVSHPTHKNMTSFDGTYTPSSILPKIPISGVYSDTDVLSMIGMENIGSFITKVSGYMLVSSTGQKYYYLLDKDIYTPTKQGEYKVYAVVDCIYSDENDTEQSHTRHIQLYLGSINIKHSGILGLIPDNIGDIVGEHPILWSMVITSVVVTLIILALIVTRIVILRKRRKKLNKKAMPTKEQSQDDLH